MLSSLRKFACGPIFFSIFLATMLLVFLPNKMGYTLATYLLNLNQLR
jgi:hypothetical protein